MKKIVTLRIEVDLDSEASKEWEKKSDFFESEIDEVFDNIDKYTSEKGQTSSGSKFELIIKKEK